MVTCSLGTAASVAGAPAISASIMRRISGTATRRNFLDHVRAGDKNDAIAQLGLRALGQLSHQLPGESASAGFAGMLPDHRTRRDMPRSLVQMAASLSLAIKTQTVALLTACSVRLRSDTAQAVCARRYSQNLRRRKRSKGLARIFAAGGKFRLF